MHRSGSQETAAVVAFDPGRGNPEEGRLGMAGSVAARLLLLSTSDTDLLAAHRSGRWEVANPARLAADDVPALLDGVALVVVRLLLPWVRATTSQR